MQRLWLKSLTVLALCVTSDACGVLKTVNRCTVGPGIRGESFSGASMPAASIALTFNGGPNDATQDISDFLFGNGVKATFFVAGRDAEQRPEILRSMKDRGHLIANHTYSERPLDAVANPILEVRKTDELISPHISGNMYLLRAPGGRFDQAMADRLNAAGLARYVGPIHWDIGDADVDFTPDDECWLHGVDVETCALGYLRKIRSENRGIVSLHASQASTLALLRTLLPKLLEEDFTLVRIDEVTAIRAALERSGGQPGTVGGADGCSEYH